MKRIFSILFSFAFALQLFSQVYSGQIFMTDNPTVFLNQIYVTNLTEHKTVLTNFNGEFKIKAKVGDVIRFTSIVSERKDLTLTDELLANKLNFVELKPAYHYIEEVVIKWKPTGNLRHDVTSLKTGEKQLALVKTIGLPTPKGDGTPPELPLLGLQGGGLAFNIGTLVALFTGENKKQKRLYAYEKMQKNIASIRQYYGDDYFIEMKIPKNMIDNFLQFVYSSDDLSVFIDAKNYDAIQIYIDKYLPIYQKRLQNSSLMKYVETLD